MSAEKFDPVAHVNQFGARFHVLYWDNRGAHCSEPRCVINQPPGAPAEPITARPAIPLRDGDRSIGSAGARERSRQVRGPDSISRRPHPPDRGK